MSEVDLCGGARAAELLTQRPARARDFERENAALRAMATELAQRPENALNKLTDLVVAHLGAGSAGVSILRENEDGSSAFYWPAIAGAWAPFVGGQMPRDASPCGVVMGRGESLVFHKVEQQFPAAAQGSPLIEELLLVPLVLKGKCIGTVWALSHDEKRFDAEDERLLRDLADFAAAAAQNILPQDVKREAEARLGASLASADVVGLWDWHIAEDRVFADRRFAALYGVDPDRAASGAPLAEFAAAFHPEDSARIAKEIKEAIDGGGTFASEYRLVKDGGDRTVLARGRVEFAPGGIPLRLSGVVVDVTEQRGREQALREAELRYQALFDVIDVAFCRIEVLFDDADRPIDYLFLEVNTAFERHTGLANAVGKTIRTLVPGIEQHWFDLYGGVVKTGKPAKTKLGAPSLEGRWFELEAFRVGAAHANNVAILFTDSTERKRAEDELRERENQLRILAEALPNHAWTATPDGKLDWFNDPVYAYSGAARGDLDGDAWASIVHPDDIPAAAAAWMQALTAVAPYEVQFRLRRADGVYRWHIARAVPVRDEKGSVLRWIGTNTDIEDQKAATEALARMAQTLESRVVQESTQRRAAEDQARQLQKMEAVGQLTGGIAHDFNNMLAVVMGALALAERRLKRGDSNVLQYLANANEGAQRAASLTQRLLAFARQQPLEPSVIDVNRLVKSISEMMRRTLPESTQIETVLGGGAWKINADPVQLENALLNLAINAHDAMPGGGKLTIETGNSHLDDAYAFEHADVTPGQYVQISLTDNGIGMTPDVAARVFEPFFTTKEVGKGTGLGLSQVYGFVKQSKGHVKVYTELGRGTTLKIYLPRHYEKGVTAGASDRDPLPLPSGNLKDVVLVVDDEERISVVTVEMVRELGYTVLHANSGEAALAVLKSHPQITLLFTDVVMPGMTGRVLADKAREINPDLRVLYTTGYTRNAIVHNGTLDPGLHFLQKPFTFDQVARKLKEVLA